MSNSFTLSSRLITHGLSGIFIFIGIDSYGYLSDLTLKQILWALRTGRDRRTIRQSNETSNSGLLAAAAYHQVMGPVPPICIEP